MAGRPAPLSRLGAAARFRRGLGALARSSVPDLEGARGRMGAARLNRGGRFLKSLDRLVLDQPTSPYRTLLAWAGAERGDIGALVRADGLEGALERLRDAGVYVAYEEWLGRRPTRRGSAEAHFRPADFGNPIAQADLFAGSGGTRSGGIPVRWSFDSLRRGADPYLLRAATWGVRGTPAALWLPGQPSGVGLASALLLLAAEGAPPERWFDPVPRSHRGRRDRLIDGGLRALARSAGVALPAPSPAPAGDPERVLGWCRSALARSGRARLGAYTGSAVRLARAAVADGLSLDGLVIATLGEPLDQARAGAIAASGAVAANGYGFMQKGTVAHGCPACDPERLHLLEGRVALIQRRREAGALGQVDAFLWSSLDLQTPTVMLNTENDDYGAISRSGPCDCELGRLGYARTVGRIRGISKVSAEGMTVGGEAFARLAHRELPRALGGGPSDYQFAQLRGGGGSRIVLRVDPAVGPIDAARAIDLVRAELGRSAAGGLAIAIWEAVDGLALERRPPVPSRSGKLLPLDLDGPA